MSETPEYEARQIRVLLTDDELGDRRRDLFTTTAAHEALELKLAPEIQMLKCLKAKARNLANTVETGYEFRDVKCTIEVNEGRHVVNYYGPDGDLVDSRPLTPDDLQEKLV